MPDNHLADRRAITQPVPAWLPRYLRGASRQPVTFSFSEAERAVLHRRRPERPSDWAEKCRVVRQSSLPGRWKNIFAPYLADLMNAMRLPGVEVGIVCKSPQTGLTEAAINLLGHAADHVPGPAMVVYADKDTAKDMMRDRILPMFEDSPRLRRHLTGAVGDESTIRVNLRHMPIFLGWAGSVARLGSRPIRLLILDEIDKYPESRREADPCALAEKRTISWRSRRLILKISTPTMESGPIWTAFTEEAIARFDWQARCPVCGAQQIMIFDNIRWPEVDDPEAVLQGKLAAYHCAHCAAVWDDAARNQAVRRGQWVERGSGLEIYAHIAQYQPQKLGFHIPAWISYFVSLSEVAHAFLRWKKSGRLADLKNFMNQYKAEPWQERHAERQENAILALCDDRPRGIVPGRVNEMPRVAALVAGIDTQAAYFRYVIRAYGFGETEESWLIQCGTAQTFVALDELLWKSVYCDAQGNSYRVKAAVIDAMGAPGRTKQVYAWAAGRPRVMAYQGKQSQATPIAYSPLEFFPDAKGAKIKIPGGLLLRRVDTTFFKSDLAEKLTIAAGDPGAFHLHADVVQRQGGIEHEGLLFDYAREMCAEVFNPESLVWENPKQKPNHFWDCEVMCLVAAWELGLRHKRPPKKETEAAKAAGPLVYPARRPVSAGERLAAMRR
ncbi:MAG: phage terminase large subunit family protein [Desulfobulbaceae bacterium]|jgi:phage terminase large subunit GpA-like protein|nr:phage terminase large subunit family protein [Desulfobulbaceae bacterium]